MITLTGKIKKYTDKAVLFNATGAASFGQPEALYGQAWWPLSQVEAMQDAIGPVDQLIAPEWLVDEKRQDIEDYRQTKAAQEAKELAEEEAASEARRIEFAAEQAARAEELRKYHEEVGRQEAKAKAEQDTADAIIVADLELTAEETETVKASAGQSRKVRKVVVYPIAQKYEVSSRHVWAVCGM